MKNLKPILFFTIILVTIVTVHILTPQIYK
jgi:hypothetical protein